jgi:hypothetical protein
MGKTIPMFRKTNAVWHCQQMGMTDMVKITAVVGAVAAQLERDQPYEAMREGMRYLDLTGTYRLMASLLTGEPQRVETNELERVAEMLDPEIAKRERKARDIVKKSRAEGTRQGAGEGDPAIPA